MSLTAGTRLGPYEIVAPIGAGGMGARGLRAERVRDSSTSLFVQSLPTDESKRGSRRGGGAPRHSYSRHLSPCR